MSSLKTEVVPNWIIVLRWCEIWLRQRVKISKRSADVNSGIILNLSILKLLKIYKMSKTSENYHDWWISKEAPVTCFKALCRHLTGGTEEKHKIPRLDSCIQTDIRTRNLPNRCLNLYSYTHINLLGSNIEAILGETSCKANFCGDTDDLLNNIC
jgi:hypothetical protein